MECVDVSHDERAYVCGIWTLCSVWCGMCDLIGCLHLCRECVDDVLMCDWWMCDWWNGRFLGESALWIGMGVIASECLGNELL